MKRGILKKSALLLLPIFVHALYLPNDILSSELRQDASGYTLDTPQYGGPSTFFEYNDHSIRFTIPCPDCTDEEKELLGQEIISIKPTLQNTQHCTSTDSIGLEINQNQIISTGESTLSLQSHVGPFDLIDNLKRNPVFQRIRWINHCGCIDNHQEGEQCRHFESSFTFEVLGLQSGEIPGFTLSYTQYGTPEILRFSTFPDIAIADSWRFGQSSHYRSPLLGGLQKVAQPSSTTISLSPSSSLLSSASATSSASSPSYTYLERESKGPTSSGGLSKQSPLLDVPVPRPTDLEHCDPRHPSRCLPDALVSLGHGFEGFGMKAKLGAQALLGKIQYNKQSQKNALAYHEAHDEVDSGYIAHDELGDDDVVVQNELDDVDTDTVSHDELGHGIAHDELGNENLRQSDRVEDFLMIDIPSSSWKLDDAATVKAFQVTSLVFIVVALFGSLSALACSNPRLRAQWATVLEERRNRRLYRHAACKQRFKSFFNRFKLSSAAEKADAFTHYSDTTLDWQGWEKRMSLDNARPDQKIDSDELRQDLLAFRKAHQFVDGIISEGSRSASSRQVRRERFASRVRHQRTWSFGSEKTAPPAYESEGEDLILDADGPRYVFLGRGFNKPDTSPDSSVVSTSPRTSCADSDSEPDEKF